jgi:hypothetical protein
VSESIQEALIVAGLLCVVIAVGACIWGMLAGNGVYMTGAPAVTAAAAMSVAIALLAVLLTVQVIAR